MVFMELGPKRPSLLWFWGPNSILVVYMDPLGTELQGLNPGSYEPLMERYEDLHKTPRA